MCIRYIWSDFISVLFCFFYSFVFQLLIQIHRNRWLNYGVNEEVLSSTTLRRPFQVLMERLFVSCVNTFRQHLRLISKTITTTLITIKSSRFQQPTQEPALLTIFWKIMSVWRDWIHWKTMFLKRLVTKKQLLNGGRILSLITAVLEDIR